MNVTAPPSTATACPGVASLLSRVGSRWTVEILAALADRPYRFNALRRHLGTVSQQTLTSTLKSLEREGIVDRTVIPSNPPAVEYRLTQPGCSVADAVRSLAQWAIDHHAVQHSVHPDRTSEAADPGRVSAAR